MVNKRFWPFKVFAFHEFSTEEKESINFLETAYRQGHRSFDCEGMVFGAIANNGRDGEIVRRGGRGRYWELIISENGKIVSSYFIDGFQNASNAVLRWLRGDQQNEIYQDIKDAIVTKPGGEKK